MKKTITASIIFLFAFLGCFAAGKSDNPRIINIINFIRQTDYRLENSDDQLFDAVTKQIELVKLYGFPATFLFQYDALINADYQRLMKEKLPENCEIGAWWEITQPQVEAAGLKWRGEHSWVSTANIAFTTGYTQREREKLADVYMAKFKDIYGKYPTAAGSWFIDSYTLNYLYEKYGIVVSCNCKDQVGTDGYTLWGGYWNQAYYPSKINAYMPAQTEEGQIPVPIFRMLGSDPIYQYETGVGAGGQGVISLEPVYSDAGKNRKWVEYFLKSIVEQPCLAFNYTQAGQENSFTWNAMREGLEMQFTIFDSLRNEGKIRMETLSQSGRWFSENHKTTPATAVVALDDIRNEGKKTVWYNSRYYRANLFWEKNAFSFRDIHLFDENVISDYYNTPGSGGQFLYFTLPVIDRFFWSTSDDKIGLKIMDSRWKEVVLNEPEIVEKSNNILEITALDNDKNKFTITFYENKIEIKGAAKDWFLELKVPQSRIDRLPFYSCDETSLRADFKGHYYQISCEKGRVNKGNNTDFVFQLIPEKKRLVIDCSNKPTTFPVDLQTDHLTNPVGIDNPVPRLAWRMDDKRQGAAQTAYRIVVGTDSLAVKNGTGNMWDTGKELSCKMLFEYAGKSLQPFTRYFWKVIVWDAKNKENMSKIYSFETGMMNAKNWEGAWIDDGKDINYQPAPYFRRTFSANKKIKSARAYIVAAGLYELSINGEKTGDHFLDPIYTRFDRRNLYVTYDITQQIVQGENAVGVLLGNGWYNHQSLAVWDFDRAPWRNRPAFRLNIRIVYNDGTEQVIATDEKWKNSSGELIFNSIYTGEQVDFNLKQHGWNTVNFTPKSSDGDLRAWENAVLRNRPSENITAQQL
ncbi:MAG: alpha-L-rhamnosidase N-terminal domain-containing protein, partial [Candidatus Symbiothrix sp.]|nr:alpha-L-rhamnosidase N-terminal domain-containing protein [Candidatus Symbiothrix sp.]